MSVSALSRLLEAVAKSIKHATATSTILALELFQARRDAAISSSELLLVHSSHELRNAPIYSQQLFDSKVKEVAKSNYKVQQHRFLASSTNNNTNVQQQKNHHTRLQVHSESLDSPQNFIDLNKKNQLYRSKNQSQSFMSNTKKDFPKRSNNIKQFPSSKHVSSSTKFWKPILSTAYPTTPRFSSGRKIGLLCGTMGRIGSSLSSEKVSGYY